MNHIKRNISLPAELHEYIESRVDRINASGKKEGTSTDFSKQIAVAVRLLVEEGSPDYGNQGNDPAPQPSKDAIAPTARTSAPYTIRKQPSRIK
jgi:hypothetical protein